MLTYDSGANEHYISEHDQHKAGLSVLRPSTWQVGVANVGTSTAKFVTQLPFCNLSAHSRQADTFQDFLTSLMSVGKTSDNCTVSVFMKESVNIFKEEDVLITCKGESVLIGIRDNQGQYQIPLMQQRAIGNHNAHPNKHGRHYGMPTMSTIYHLPSKPSNGCTPSVDTRSN
jgi:hypothetical protein